MMKVLYIGQFSSPSGYSKSARDFILAMYQQGVKEKIDLKLYDVKFDQINYNDDRIASILKEDSLNDKEVLKYIEQNKGKFLLLAHIPLCTYNTSKNGIIAKINKASAYSVNMTLWEADKIPDDWKQIAKEHNIQHFIANCLWNQSVFEKDFGIPCSYVPCVIDNTVYSMESIHLDDPDVFKILAVSTLDHRKGFDILVKAYLTEFNKQNDVSLFIKTYHSSFDDAAKQRCVDFIKNLKSSVLFGNVTQGFHHSSLPIKLLLEKMTHEEMSKMYNSVDAYALFSRGEGFGLPYAEAIVHGLPVICPSLGGHTDFCKPEFTIQAESHLDVCTNHRYWYSGDMNQFETSILEARKALRKAYDLWKNNKNELERMSKEAKEYVTNDQSVFSFKSVGQKLISILTDLGGNI